MLAKIKNLCIFIPLTLFSSIFPNPAKPDPELATPSTVQAEPEPEPNPGLSQTEPEAEPLQPETSEATPPVFTTIQTKEKLDEQLDSLKSQLGELANGEPKKRLEGLIESARKIEPLKVEKGKKLDDLHSILTDKRGEISSLLEK
jgi:hypothetical protein